MSGEITGVRTSDGTLHQIDYESLANKPSIPNLPSWDTVSISSDAGDVLSVASNGSLAWASVNGGVLPAWDRTNNASDYGKSLTVGGDGDLSWVEVVPEHNNTTGQVLVTTSNEGDKDWVDVNGGVLPSWDAATGGADEGCVLAVDGCGDLCWHEPNGLPSLSNASAGDVLRVDGYGTGAEWDSVNGGLLPSWDSDYAGSDDEGKVLAIDRWGYLEWSDQLAGVSGTPYEGRLIVADSHGKPWWNGPGYAFGGGDVGDVLTVSDTYGNVEWTSMSAAALPTYSDESKQVLAVGGSYEDPTWIDVNGGVLPSSDDRGEGDVLVVADNYGTIGWVQPSSLVADALFGWSVSSANVLMAGGTHDEPEWVEVMGGVFPDPTSADAGSVLAMADTDGTLGWVSPDSLGVLPSTTVEDSLYGDVLCAYGSDGVAWSHVNGGVLPAWHSGGSDDGKVLGIVNDRLAWVTP